MTQHNDVLPCPPEEYRHRCKAALAEAGWPDAKVRIQRNGEVSIQWEPGMPNDLLRAAHAIAHGMTPAAYLPCAECYERGYGDECFDGRCRAGQDDA